MGREAILNLARTGRVGDAWKAWEDLPPTIDQPVPFQRARPPLLNPPAVVKDPPT